MTFKMFKHCQIVAAWLDSGTKTTKVSEKIMASRPPKTIPALYSNAYLHKVTLEGYLMCDGSLKAALQ